MSLFCAAITRDSVVFFCFFLRFLFLSYAQVFSYAISLVCNLKYQYICFSSDFFYPVFIVVLFFLILSVLLLAAVISLSLLFFYLQFSSPCVHGSKQSSTLVNPRLLLFLTHIVCLRFLSEVRPCALSLISCYLVYFINRSQYLTMRITRVFILLMRFLLQLLVSRSFLVRL